MIGADSITTLGTTLGRHPGRPFGIKQADRLFHMYIVGQTGTGKSTLLLNLMRQDVTSGQGFCLIDPHGDLAESVVATAADCLYWNVADPTCPLGYNPLTHVAAEHRPLVASGILDALKKQWEDAWGARMEHLLRMALLALLERPGSSLADVMPLFLDAEFRKEVVATLTDPQLRLFWTYEYKALRYQTTVDGIAPIANKIGGLLAHPVVRKALCEPVRPLRFRRIMDEGGTLIVNLAKGRLGADVANVVGGIVVATMAHAAYSRQQQALDQRRPFFLYIDEFHSFTTAALADMLSELRKYGLALVLTTQFGGQLEAHVRESVFGNVGTIVAFRVGAGDASDLIRQFGDDAFQPRDLVNLANHEMAVKLMIDGRQSRPFSALTRAPDSVSISPLSASPLKPSESH